MDPSRSQTTTGETTDKVAELIRQVAERTPHCLDRLVEETTSRMQGIIRRIVQDRDSIESILSEVYAQVWRIAERYNERLGSGMAWLAVIARSRTIDHVRRNQRSKDELKGGFEFDSVESGEPDPAYTSEQTEQARSVRRALDRLPIEQRKVIAAVFYGGLTHPQIAEQLGQPLGTVKTRIRTAMATLRQSLSQTGEGYAS